MYTGESGVSFFFLEFLPNPFGVRPMQYNTWCMFKSKQEAKKL